MLDLVITSDDVYGHGGQSVSVLLGRGDGTFAWAAGYSVDDSSPIGDGPIEIYSPVLADYNGDGAVHNTFTMTEKKLEEFGLYVDHRRGEIRPIAELTAGNRP
jgi:hypothetical protein